MSLTKNRKYLVRRKFWMGAALAFLIFLPYLIWQVRNGFPTLEFYANYASGKTYPVTPLQFILDQFVSLNPLAAPVWLLGLFYVLFHKQGRRFRVLGLAYLALLAVFIFLKAKYYMPAPFYPVLFGAGAVLMEEFIDKKKPSFKWLKPVSVAAIFLAGAAMVPMARPVLPVETFIDYSKGWTGVKQETHDLEKLPQHFADMFGWPELAAEVAKVYRSLPEEERNRACIFADNYGEAGAIWLFGREYGLPRPISGHNQYFLWGPRDCAGDLLIAFGPDEDDLKQAFEDVREAGRFHHDYCMPYENDLPIFICRRPRMSIKEAWPLVKNFN